MNVNDSVYISIGDTILYIEIEAYRNLAGEGTESDSLHPDEIDYPGEARQYAAALEVVREALVDLDEHEPASD